LARDPGIYSASEAKITGENPEEQEKSAENKGCAQTPGGTPGKERLFFAGQVITNNVIQLIAETSDSGSGVNATDLNTAR
jgi:hypothetical protein